MYTTAYLNFVPGVLIMFAFIPIQTWFYRRDREKNGGKGRPEARFITSLVFVWGFPISLLWFAFTSDGTVSYWSPIVAGGFLGFCDPLLWLSMLNYITGTFPNSCSDMKYTKLLFRLISKCGRLCHCCFPYSLFLYRHWPLPRWCCHV